MTDNLAHVVNYLNSLQDRVLTRRGAGFVRNFSRPSPGCILFDYEPGNMTQYTLYVAPFRDDLVLISLVNFGRSMFFPVRSCATPAYFGEKLRLSGGDSIPLAELFDLDREIPTSTLEQSRAEAWRVQDPWAPKENPRLPTVEEFCDIIRVDSDVFCTLKAIEKYTTEIVIIQLTDGSILSPHDQACEVDPKSPIACIGVHGSTDGDSEYGTEIKFKRSTNPKEDLETRLKEAREEVRLALDEMRGTEIRRSLEDEFFFDPDVLLNLTLKELCRLDEDPMAQMTPESFCSAPDKFREAQELARLRRETGFKWRIRLLLWGQGEIHEFIRVWAAPAVSRERPGFYITRTDQAPEEALFMAFEIASDGGGVLVHVDGRGTQDSWGVFDPKLIADLLNPREKNE